MKKLKPKSTPVPEGKHRRTREELRTIDELVKEICQNGGDPEPALKRIGEKYDNVYARFYSRNEHHLLQKRTPARVTAQAANGEVAALSHMRSLALAAVESHKERGSRIRGGYSVGLEATARRVERKAKAQLKAMEEDDEHIPEEDVLLDDALKHAQVIKVAQVVHPETFAPDQSAPATVNNHVTLMRVDGRLDSPPEALPAEAFIISEEPQSLSEQP